MKIDPIITTASRLDGRTVVCAQFKFEDFETAIEFLHVLVAFLKSHEDDPERETTR